MHKFVQAKKKTATIIDDIQEKCENCDSNRTVDRGWPRFIIFFIIFSIFYRLMHNKWVIVPKK